MGAYVSVYECSSHYNVTIDCTHSDYNNETREYHSLSNFRYGEFPSNPDVAGIGVRPSRSRAPLVLADDTN